MKQNELQIQEYQYDDEIDLYELVEIIVKNKWIVISTFVLLSVLSLVGALYIRKVTPSYLEKQIIINNVKEIEGVNKIDPQNILYRDNNVKRLVNISGIKEMYIENTPKENQGITSEREYLKDIISIVPKSKDGDNIIVKTKIIGEQKNNEALINEYIEILGEEDNLLEVIESKKELMSKSLSMIKIELASLESKIAKILSKEKITRDLKVEEIEQYLSLKYPEISLRRKELGAYYEKYSTELLNLNLIEPKNRIRSNSDIYFVKGESKAKLILAVGIVASMFISIMLTFIKEFIEGYKNRKKNK